MFGLNLSQTPSHNRIVKILTSQMCVTSGGQDFKYSRAQVQDGCIKGSSTQIENQYIALGEFFLIIVFLLVSGGVVVESVGEGGRSGLVNDTFDGHASNASGIFGGLTLLVIEMGRDGNDTARDLGAQM
mmetsp:Transcript_3210/g.5830  ORF Transcript_3210/g.5830 Transcript_3210/m.5830 type:complete len:129 (+) Transcript_3210:1250-1636(+)